MPTAVEPGPADWQVVRLGDIASIVLGGTPSTAVPSFWGGDINWMSSGEVNVKQVWDVAGRITEAGLASSNATMVDPPAVAIGLAGQGKTRGTAALVHTRLCTNQSIALVRGHDGLALSRFLYHNLDRRYEELRAVSSGGGRGGLSRSILKDVDVLLPPLREQHRISDILDAVDEVIHETEGIVAKLRQIKLGLLHDLLTRGVDEGGELRAPPTEAASLYRESPGGLLPRQWQLLTLRELCSLLNGLAFRPEEWGDEGLPIIRIQNLNGSQDFNYCKRRVPLEYVIPPETLLFSWSGNRGTSFGPFIWHGPTGLLNQHIFRVEPTRGQQVDWFCLALDDVRQRVERAAHGGSGLVHVRRGDLLAYRIPTPPLAEQERIADMVRGLQSRLDCEQEHVSKLASIRRGLADDLLTGRVRVDLLEGARA